MNKKAESKRSLFSLAASTVFLIAAAVGVLCLPHEASAGISKGIDYSLSILLPSLFPFMFLVSFASRSGITDAIGGALSGVTKRILALPGAAGVTALLSLVGGYPVGAAGIGELLRNKQITPGQARRMLLFCVNPGPAFLINTIGVSLLNIPKAGVVLLCANSASALIVGIVTGLFSGKEAVTSEEKQIKAPRPDLPAAIISSVRSSCGNCVSLCSLVVLFSAFSQVLLAVLPLKSEMSAAIVQSFLEVTDAVSALCRLHVPIYFTAAAVGWGGLCVHLQVFSAVPELKAELPQFFLGRAAMAALSAGITYLICRFICTDIEVFSNVSETSALPSSLPPNGSIMLMICCVMFLIFIKPSRSADDISVVL